MNIFTFLLAITFFPLFILMGFTYSLRYLFTKFFWTKLDEKFKKSAVLMSHLFNVWSQEALNNHFIKQDGYKYGDEDDSASDVTGRNLRDKTILRCLRDIRYSANFSIFAECTHS
jgi:hypothetical protein